VRLDGVKTIGELNGILSERAVEAIRRAALASAPADARLQQLVAPSAEFSSGSGDVGLPLGTGIDGARALARKMKATRYRYRAWSSIPTPEPDPCASHDAEVEFEAAGDDSFTITFTFAEGRIVAASGWRQSLVTGPIEPTRK
jgi:hypothetical protein